MLRISEIRSDEHLVALRPQLHVNFSHPVCKGLMKLHKSNKELAEKVTQQVCLFTTKRAEKTGH